MTETALHRTRLRFLDHKNYSVFSTNQTARTRQCWRLIRNPKLKTLKRISVFFSKKDVLKISRLCNLQKNRGFYYFGESVWARN